MIASQAGSQGAVRTCVLVLADSTLLRATITCTQTGRQMHIGLAVVCVCVYLIVSARDEGE